MAFISNSTPPISLSLSLSLSLSNSFNLYVKLFELFRCRIIEKKKKPLTKSSSHKSSLETNHFRLTFDNPWEFAKLDSSRKWRR